MTKTFWVYRSKGSTDYLLHWCSKLKNEDGWWLPNEVGEQIMHFDQSCIDYLGLPKLEEGEGPVPFKIVVEEDD